MVNLSVKDVNFVTNITLPFHLSLPLLLLFYILFAISILALLILLLDTTTTVYLVVTAGSTIATRELAGANCWR